MHLHDALRLWRTEIIAPEPKVALASDDVRDGDSALVAAFSRESLPGDLRRDDRCGVLAVLGPAEHRPARPASAEDLDALEGRLGVELPREVELLLSLHDGGEFFAAAVPGLSDGLAAPLQLLSCVEIGDAYEAMLARIAETLDEQDPEEDDYFRVARRFGAPREEAEVLASQLGAVRSGVRRGLDIVPIARVAGSDDLITFVPRSGKAGRVGHAYAVSGYLPEHSDEFPFDGIEGWLEALVRGKGCRRVAT